MRLVSIVAASLFALGITAAAAGEPIVDTSEPHNQPPYPSAAEVNGEQGTVEITLYVHRNGHVTRVHVSRSSGFADLDNAAVEGVMGWKFVPAVENHRWVSAWKTVRIVYQLPPPPANPPTPAK